MVDCRLHEDILREIWNTRVWRYIPEILSDIDHMSLRYLKICCLIEVPDLSQDFIGETIGRMDLSLQDFAALQKVEFYWDDPKIVFCSSFEVFNASDRSIHRIRVEEPNEMFERTCEMVRCCLPTLDARGILHFCSSYHEDGVMS